MAASPSVHVGDLHVAGHLSSQTAGLPAGSVLDEHVGGSAAIAGTKTLGRLRQRYAQESATTAAAESRVLHVAHAAGTVVAFKAGCVVANLTGATVTFDLLKNGMTILTAAVQVNDTHAAREVVPGTIATPGIVAGDVLETVITVAAGGGTLGKGAFCLVVLDEAPQ